MGFPPLIQILKKIARRTRHRDSVIGPNRGLRIFFADPSGLAAATHRPASAEPSK
jgi:hypothetical protein